MIAVRDAPFPPRRLSVVSAPFTLGQLLDDLGMKLARSVLDESDPTDVIQIFWKYFKPGDLQPLLNNALDILNETRASLDTWKNSNTDSKPSRGPDIPVDILGVMVDWLRYCIDGSFVIMSQRLRGNVSHRQCPDPDVAKRWKTSFALCEIVAVETGLAECFPYGKIDNCWSPSHILRFDCSEECFFRSRRLDALWELLILSAWWVETMESLIREALRWHASQAWASPTDNAESKFRIDDHCESLGFTLLTFVYITRY